jgi:hypothetical protein
MHKTKLTGEAASADKDAAAIFPADLKNIAENNYDERQIFKVEETGLYCNKMPSRTSVAKYIRSSLNFSVERKFCKAFPI